MHAHPWRHREHHSTVGDTTPPPLDEAPVAPTVIAALVGEAPAWRARGSDRPGGGTGAIWYRPDVGSPGAPGDEEASGAAPAFGDVLDFLLILWSVDHELHSQSKRMLARHGVTSPQRLAIKIIGRFPGIRAGELATLMHLHPSTLTGVLRRLEQRGMIQRKPESDDRRRAALTLTQRGRGKDSLRSGTIESIVRRAFGRIDAADVAAARRVLQELASALKKGDGLRDQPSRRPRAPR